MAISPKASKKRRIKIKPKAEPKARGIPGINIQWPWSSLIVDGKKSIETRKYPLPDSKKNTPIALIETSGPRGKKEAGIRKARIIAIITFTDCYQYKSKAHWEREYKKHRVPTDDPQYRFSSLKPKWAWKTKVIKKFRPPIPGPRKKGIIWATTCLCE